MRDYLVIETAAGADPGPWREGEAQVLASGGWTKVAERRRFSVFLETARPPVYRHLPGAAGALIGDAFDAAAARRGVGAALDLLGLGVDPDQIAERLVTQAFGRYVAILDGGEGRVRVLRDPLGVMEAIGWRRGPLRFIASRLPDLPQLWPPDLAIDFDRLAAILRQKNLASLICPLIGVVSYQPGVLSGPDGQGARLWSPGGFARRPMANADPAALRTVLDGVVAAWALGRQGVFCEISGGLDSAIVATSLARTRARLLYGLNHSFDRAEGDERLYAQAVADQIGVRLEVVARAPLRLDPAKLTGAAGGAKLNYVGGDPDHDADLAQRLGAPGVEAMFTGRGGDGVFYQPRHPVLVRDVLAGRAGVGRLRGLDLLARRNATTVWRLIRQGLAAQDMTAGLGVGMFLTQKACGEAQRHPWLEAARTLAPAKQLQILALVNGLSAFGESQRHRAGDVIDPLMSQPVVEFCLSVAAGRLAVGDNDRPFARTAFAERLPQEVLARQVKGDLTTWFARGLGDSLEPLRAWLLDGRLVAAGLVDRARLDPALSVAQLVWTSITSELFVLMAAEAWVRRGEARLAAVRSGAA